MEPKIKYMYIYNDVKNKINNNKYKIDTKLPTETELAEIYNCSKLTVKKALGLLESEGMLIRRRGSGTYVKRHSILNNEFIIEPTSSLTDQYGEKNVESKIVKFLIEKPTEKIAEILNIEDDYIYHIERIRYINKQPYSIEYTYMPLSLIKGLEPKHLEHSIYNYIQDVLKLKIKTGHIFIRGKEFTKEEKKLLNIKNEKFSIELEKKVYLDDGSIFEYSATKHLYEHFVFETIFVNN